jgi:hypothetical protein
MPRDELGGEDLPVEQRFEVYEEIASYVGSVGRAFMTLSSFVGYTASDWQLMDEKKTPTAQGIWDSLR